MRHAWVGKVGMVALVGFLVLAGNPYTAHAGKPVPPPPPAMPRVVDANNNVVGEVIGTNNEAEAPVSLTGNPFYAIVALNISVPSIVVQVTPNGFLGTASLFFTDSTCVGQPYFLSQEVNFALRLFPVVGVARSGATLYAPRASSASVVLPTTYRLNFLGECQLKGTNVVVIADPLIDLTTQFTPPYRFVYP